MKKNQLKVGQVFHIYTYDSGKTYLTGRNLSPIERNERIIYGIKHDAMGALIIKSLK